MPPRAPSRVAPRDSILRIEHDVARCTLCPRLRRYCLEIARSKRRAYMDQEYWGRPVPGFGDPRARLWVLGLAPAAHGGNRTGRVFTGDSSGDWLFRALHAHGFAHLATSTHRDDGQQLEDAYVSAAARCAPPDNKPLPVELDRCARYLARELDALSRLEVVLPLGRIAFDSALRLLQQAGFTIPRPRPRFAHAAKFVLQPIPGATPQRPITVLASYHPSRQNTQTGKLTRAMLDDVFRSARRLLQPRG